MEHRSRFFEGIVIGAFLMMVAHLFLLKCERAGITPTTSTDTLRVTDTFYIDKPVPVKDSVTAHVRRKLIVLHDTLFVALQPDSLYASGDSVIVPITQTAYTDDSTYTAWVSGYNAQLDSIRTYRQRVYVTKTISVKPPKRWSLGLQGGFYITPKGLQPGLGLGVTYNIPP